MKRDVNFSSFRFFGGYDQTINFYHGHSFRVTFRIRDDSSGAYTFDLANDPIPILYEIQSISFYWPEKLS